MIKRAITKLILDSLSSFPVVGLIGARQVGKTTLAKDLAKQYNKPIIYLDLELTQDLMKLEEAELYLNQHKDKLVVIDEIQRKPELFPLLRALVDQKRDPGRFLILGSASVELLKQASESLAGRIVYHELMPFNLHEAGIDSFKELWLKGGFPDSYLAKTIKNSSVWREAFIRTYLERDLPQFGFRVPAMQIKRFLVMIAHQNGQLWNASQIATSMGLSAPTVRHYLDILSDTFILRQLQPFHKNVGKRLIKSPKIFFRDTGILHHLLNIDSHENLQANPIIGFSWEGYIIEEIIKSIPPSYQPYFYRTNAGAEIDLLLVRGIQPEIAIEIKYSLNPRVQKGFWNATHDINPDKKLIIYPGNESFPYKNDTQVLSILDLPKWLSTLKG